MTFNIFILRMFLHFKSISSVFFDLLALRRRESEEIMDFQVFLIQNEKIQKMPYFLKNVHRHMKIGQILEIAYYFRILKQI